jgi:ubiquinone/menaquinone biosynthesis C-methylase UbiE
MEKTVTQQRTDEWVKFDEHQLSYHTKQWNEQNDSTLAFYDFVKHKLSKTNSIIDLGAGAGAATSFIAAKAPRVSLVAADYVDDYLEIGKSLAKTKGIENLSFRQVDWLKLQETKEFDGVISLQTLSWLPEFRTPLEKVFISLKPKWFALTSLFYEGDITCTIEVLEHTINRKMFYNIYSLPELQRIANENGYRLTKCKKFEISFDLQKPNNPNLMATYTKKVVENSGHEERLQVSGPVLMPWYMLLLERSNS